VSLDLTAIDKRYKSAGILDPLGMTEIRRLLLNGKTKDQQEQSTAATYFDAFPQYLHRGLNDLRNPELLNVWRWYLRFEMTSTAGCRD
jgi:hypothetical protein